MIPLLKHIVAEDMAKGTIVALVWKGLAMIAALVLTIVIARSLGPSGSGQYFTFVGLAVIGSAIVRLGLDHIVVREGARTLAVGQSAAVQRLKSDAVRIVLASASIVFLVAISILLVIPSSSVISQYRLSCLAALFALIPISYMTILAETYRGIRRIAAYQIFHVNGFLLAATVSTTVVLFQVESAESALVAYGLSTVFVAIIGEISWKRTVAPGINPGSRYRELIKAGVPLIWVTLCQVVMLWLPILLLKLLATDVDAGHFAVAARTAQLVTIGLVIVNSIAGPKFAESSAKNDSAGLEATWKYAIKTTALVGIPLAIVLVVLSEDSLGALFGREFREAGATLRILVVGQFVSMLCGSVQLLLIMAGLEKIVTKIVLVTSALMVLSLVPLIYVAGNIGAALAVSSAIVLQNIWMSYQVERQLQLQLFRSWVR